MKEKEFLDYYKPFEDFENSIYKNVFTRVIKNRVEEKSAAFYKYQVMDYFIENFK